MNPASSAEMAGYDRMSGMSSRTRRRPGSPRSTPRSTNAPPSRPRPNDWSEDRLLMVIDRSAPCARLSLAWNAATGNCCFHGSHAPAWEAIRGVPSTWERGNDMNMMSRALSPPAPITPGKWSPRCCPRGRGTAVAHCALPSPGAGRRRREVALPVRRTAPVAWRHGRSRRTARRRMG
ncbi:hypothetical protein D9M68_385350 [compost metagenome]